MKRLPEPLRRLPRPILFILYLIFVICVFTLIIFIICKLMHHPFHFYSTVKYLAFILIFSFLAQWIWDRLK